MRIVLRQLLTQPKVESRRGETHRLDARQAEALRQHDHLAQAAGAPLRGGPMARQHRQPLEVLPPGRVRPEGRNLKLEGSPACFG